MPFCLIIAATSAKPIGPLANQSENVFKQLYRDHQQQRHDWSGISLITASLKHDRRTPWNTHQDGIHGLVSAGSWFYGHELACGQENKLLERMLSQGFSKALDKLEGVFCLGLINTQNQHADIVIDPAGSYHVYHVKFNGAILISDSALALASITKATLNAQGVHQFVATGIVYGQDSIWQGLTKLPPACHLSIRAFEPSYQQRHYWHFDQIQPERYTVNQAASELADALTATANSISQHFPNLLCDLTGGYDSRAMMAGFLLAGKTPHTTVSGAENSADAQVAKIIAQHFNLPHRRVERKAILTSNNIEQALLLTDGEYDLFEYAGTAATHQDHIAAGHDISINGSFGELARGYWWELLFPRIGARIPLDTLKLAQKRFAAAPYQQSLFQPEVLAVNLAESLAQLTQEKLQGLSGFPNTTQMDYAYFSMRMQRWQGRIASSTNRLWPAVSPFAFRPILKPILEAKANTRLRSLLVRTLLANHIPELGQIPLEHGYPAMPANFGNIHQFLWPLFGHYSERVLGKLMRHHAKSTPPTHHTAKKDLVENALLADYLPVPELCASGLLLPEKLQTFMQSPANQSTPEWRRLMTLELAISKVRDCQ